MPKRSGRQPDINNSLPVMNAIEQFMIQNTYAPSMRELSVLTGLSPSNVSYHMKKLSEHGYIEYQTGKARTIVILKREVDDG